MIRSNGEPTYFAADLGYLIDKFGRGFDRLIYLWGADHHGTVPRLMAAVEALGFDREAVEIPLMQIVTLTRGGEAVKASKRQGIYVALDELIDEVGVDAARYTFLTRSLEASCRADTFTATRRGGNPSCCQALHCRQASRNTHSPIELMSPHSSASGMKSSGMIVPCSGCCQRMSASALWK